MIIIYNIIHYILQNIKQKLAIIGIYFCIGFSAPARGGKVASKIARKFCKISKDLSRKFLCEYNTL